MTRLRMQHGAVNLSQGFPDFPAPDGGQGRGLRGDRRPTSTSTPSPGARGRCARRSRAKFTRRYGVAVDRRRAGHRLLRLHRGDDGDDARRSSIRATRSRLRAVLRELRPGRDPLRRRRRATSRCTSRTGRSTRTSCAAAFNDQTQGDHHQHAEQPDRQGLHARRARDDRRALPASGTRSRSPTRSTSTSSTTAHEHVPMATHRRAWPSARSRSTACRRPISVTGWRVGWTISPPALTGGDPQGARLPDRRRAGAAAGGGRRRARPARRLLREARRRATSSGATCCSTILERHQLHAATSRSARTTS